jgi:hypothetical protein
VKCETIRSRDGDTTVRVDGKSLHSTFSPRREADRAAARFTLDEGTGILLVLGEGVPYFSARLKQIYRHLEVIAVTIGDAGATPEEVHRFAVPGEARDDEITGSLRRRLRSRIHPLQAGRVQAVLWQSVEACAPSWIAAVRNGVIAALKDLQSEVATIGSFGRLWIANALRRSIFTDTRAAVTIRGPLVIAAAGPSMTDAIRTIRTSTNPFPAVMAASSAVDPLLAEGITPDLVFHSDAGFWARRYRHPARSRGIPTVSLLRAAPGPGSAGRDEGVILLRTGWFGETIAPDRDEWASGAESPTVAGEIVDYLGRYVPATRVDLVGLDLCSRDLRTHAIFHANDRYISATADRLRPEHTIRAIRSGYLSDAAPLHWQDGTAAFRTESLETFAAHLEGRLHALGSRHVLGDPLPSPARTPLFGGHTQDTVVNGVRPAPTEVHSRNGNGSRRPSVTVTAVERPPRAERIRHALGSLAGWDERIDAPAHDAVRAEILLHFAPVEALRAHIDDRSRATAEEKAREGITRMRRWLQDA